MMNKNIIKITIGIWVSIIIMCIFVGVRSNLHNFNYYNNNYENYHNDILEGIEENIEENMNIDYNFDDNDDYDYNNFDDHDNYDYSNFNEHNETTIKETINYLKVEWIKGNILIQPTTSNEIKIVHQTNKDISNLKKMMVSVQGDQLIVKDRRMYRMRNYPSSDVIVYLPEKTYENIVLNSVSANIKSQTHLYSKAINAASVSGNIDIESTADDTSFNTVSGNIECGNIQSENLNFNSVSGNVNISGTFNDIEINTVSGTVNIKSDKMISEILANSVSGNCHISIPENDGFIVKSSKLITSGNLKSDFPLNINSREATYKNASAKYEIITMTGKCYITQS